MAKAIADIAAVDPALAEIFLDAYKTEIPNTSWDVVSDALAYTNSKHTPSEPTRKVPHCSRGSPLAHWAFGAEQENSRTWYSAYAF